MDTLLSVWKIRRWLAEWRIALWASALRQGRIYDTPPRHRLGLRCLPPQAR